MEKFRTLVNKYRRFFLPVLLGGIAGYLYYRFVGCTDGGCMISSNPWISTSYGILLGALLADALHGSSRKTQKTKLQHEQ